MIDGALSAPILIVGTAPGREDLAQGKPFIGGSGRLLWAMARNAGFTRSDCLLLNCIGEWPAGATGKPTKEQLEKYWDIVDQTLIASQAKVAIILGGDALERITGLHGIEGWRGYILEPSDCLPLTRRELVEGVYKTNTKLHKKGDPKISTVRTTRPAVLPPGLMYLIPALDPAAILRSGMATLPALAVDMDRAYRLLKGATFERFSDIQISEKAFFNTRKEPVAIDIETGGRVPPINNIITRVGVAASEGTWSAPYGEQIQQELGWTLGDETTTKIFHNRAFDEPRLRAYGYQVRGKKWDTMLAAAMLQPDLYKGLNAVGSLYLDTKRWKHLSEEDPALYNALDVHNTRRLYFVLRKQLQENGQLELFENVIMPGTDVLMRMTERGMKLDQERRRKWVDELSSEVLGHMQKWETLAPGVQHSSPKQVAEFFYQKLGAKPVRRGRGGESVDINSLKAIEYEGLSRRDDNLTACAQTLMDIRKIDKLLGTYAKYPVGGDGCIHPSFLPAAKDDDDPTFGKGLAGTWRITSRDPNFQNQPMSARNIYVPHDGFWFLEADFKQIELRICAALSGDEALLRALEETDPFAVIMDQLGVDRVRAKNLMYGTIYGAGPRKLAQTLRAHGFVITEAECKALQNQVARAYPKLRVWREAIIKRVKVTYEIVNPFGLRRFFYDRSSCVPAALNVTPQSTAGMIIWHSLAPLEMTVQACNGYLVNTVHDNFLMEFPLTISHERASSMVADVLEREWPQIAPGFRVPVEFKYGDAGTAWGELRAIQ